LQSNKPEKPSIDKSKAEKILRSVPFDQGFHFATDLGKFTGETAINLFSFYEELGTIEPQSVKFHFYRRDFQKWVETTLQDSELASRMDKVASGLTDEELKEELLKTVQARFTELENASKKTGFQEGMSASGEVLKRFTLEDLRKYSGQAGNPAYFAFEGNVYDVSASGLWVDGLHQATHVAGEDLTQALKSAPHGEEVFSKVKKVGILI
jgi:predicted heme/steroid binding protein